MWTLAPSSINHQPIIIAVTMNFKGLFCFVALLASSCLVDSFVTHGHFGSMHRRHFQHTTGLASGKKETPEVKHAAESRVPCPDRESLAELLDELKRRILKSYDWDKTVVDDANSVRARGNETEIASHDEVRKQREAEPRDMRLLGNMARLFIDEVVDPIMAMSQEVIADTPDGTAYDRSFCVYLSHVRNYASVLFCEQNPTPYNEMGLRHLRMPYRYNVTERMERVDRALFPVTGVKVLELGLAMDAYHRHTMHHWTCEYSNDEDSLDRFLTECEECEWREEWRDLGTKMTRAVRSKISSNIYQGLKVYCDNPNR